MADSEVERLVEDMSSKAAIQHSPQEESEADGELPKSGHVGIKSSGSSGTQVAGAAMPPAMQEVRESTAEEVLDLMNKMPLFMTDLEAAEDGGDNIALEAIKALAYEGTKAEIAGNFREQGNEAAREKKWVDAREFYDKALQTLAMTDEQLRDVKGGEGTSDFEVIDVDETEEERKRDQVREASLVNRALCNLEMSTATQEGSGNYGACNRDCAATLKINPRNVKAWYRSASACLALDKIDQAGDACSRGLEVDALNAALKALSGKIAKRKQYIADVEQARVQREGRKRAESVALQVALRTRKISNRTTKDAPDMEDAALSLEDPLNSKSTLKVPVVLLYPLHAQTDFIKHFAENENLAAHLEYILPLPWDQKAEYTLDKVDCYVETTSGGLIKAGKNMELLRILCSGKVELVNDMLSISVVPRDRASEYINEFKARKGK